MTQPLEKASTGGFVQFLNVQGQPLQPGIEAFQRVWGDRPNAPANTVMYVSELVPADFLLCIDAIAVLPW